MEGSVAASVPENAAASVVSNGSASGTGETGLPPPISLDTLFLQYGSYSTALSITVAVGSSLLVLNLLIFCGVYYQRDRVKEEKKEKVCELARRGGTWVSVRVCERRRFYLCEGTNDLATKLRS